MTTFNEINFPQDLTWTPQSRQYELLRHKHIPIAMFGGARGGGKSDCLLADFMQDVHEGTNWRGIFVRKTYPELEEAIDRFCEIYANGSGVKYNKTTKKAEIPGGATLIFRQIESLADLEKLQGKSRAWVGVDEAGNYKTDEIIRRLLGINRGHSLSRLRLSANPGGVGHSWIDEWFVRRNPKGGDVFLDPSVDADDALECIYIPSLVTDNQKLLEKDPGYIKRLKAVGSKALVSAWLLGDWSAIQGAYFDKWAVDKHVVRTTTLPLRLSRARSFDWGSYHPFSHGWYAVSDSSVVLSHPVWGAFTPPVGSIIKYREWYGKVANNKGLRLEPKDIAMGVLARQTDGEVFCDSVADRAFFNKAMGRSIAEIWHEKGLTYRAAQDDRVQGLQQVKARLEGQDSLPTLYIMDCCADTIRLMPIQQHAKNKPEDMDTDIEDHCIDELRYACMTRVTTAEAEVARQSGHLYADDIDPDYLNLMA